MTPALHPPPARANHPFFFLEKAPKNDAQHKVSETSKPAPDMHPESPILCAQCESTVSNARHLFASDGQQSARVFANPRGILFEVITLTRAENLLIMGRPCDEFTWFPDYTWQVCACAQCSNHLGWFFDGIGPAKTPDSFYALIRSELKEVSPS